MPRRFAVAADPRGAARSRRVGRVRLGAALALGIALAAGLAAGSTPLPARGQADDEPSDVVRAAGLYAGTCADLWDLAAELNPVGPGQASQADGGGEPADFVGSEGAAIVEVSATEVDLGLDDLLDEPHALVVGDADDSEEAVACGEVGGYTRFVGGVRDLAIGLREVDDSGLGGVASLQVNRGAVIVRVFLAPIA